MLGGLKNVTISNMGFPFFTLKRCLCITNDGIKRKTLQEGQGRKLGGLVDHHAGWK